MVDMEVRVFETPGMLGAAAADIVSRTLNEAIGAQGFARLLLSTGASQFDTLRELTARDVDWSKVEMFHLDEYIGIPESHPASFRKYLKDRLTSFVRFKQVHFINPEAGVDEVILRLTEEIRRAPIDLGVIGVGENAHIAFNDPPADFDSREAFFVVTLDERCKAQQMGEGWYKTIDEVPKTAISMTPYQIMRCGRIISCVPYAVKADAIKAMLEAGETTNLIPATLLKEHPDIVLMLDRESAAKTDPKFLPN
jgi:glucosamine-6-phosphate deaminase